VRAPSSESGDRLRGWTSGDEEAEHPEVMRFQSGVEALEEEEEEEEALQTVTKPFARKVPQSDAGMGESRQGSQAEDRMYRSQGAQFTGWQAGEHYGE
jgi:hypothetical protein